jgi:hypothetical protein
MAHAEAQRRKGFYSAPLRLCVRFFFRIAIQFGKQWMTSGRRMRGIEHRGSEGRGTDGTRALTFTGFYSHLLIPHRFWFADVSQRRSSTRTPCELWPFDEELLFSLVCGSLCSSAAALSTAHCFTNPIREAGDIQFVAALASSGAFSSSLSNSA